MNRYKVTCNPNWESWSIASSTLSASTVSVHAEKLAEQNCNFVATPEDVELIEENIDED